MASNLFKTIIHLLIVNEVLSTYMYQYPANQFYQPAYSSAYPKTLQQPYPESYPYQQYNQAIASFVYPQPAKRTVYPTHGPNYPKQTFANPNQELKAFAYPNLESKSTSYPNQELKTFAYPNQESKSTFSYPNQELLTAEVANPNSVHPNVESKSKTDDASPKEKRKPAFDPNVLNNLAIALQLLIVSNIISNPPDATDTGKLPEKLDSFKQEYTEKTPFQTLFEANTMELHRALPNAKFLGETDMMNNCYPKSLPARAGGLKSPYEAINSNPFEAPAFSNNEFQNPYSAMITFDNNKELFSDLF
ncbi:unnamed protein product [Leptosia nina]|uniref:Uncharacterized protein n=1 Tax=Leptosia nina TaxID=320188 RepID=A0AAV1JHU7_9NEOP